jgi:virulence-associated protein VapD
MADGGATLDAQEMAEAAEASALRAEARRLHPFVSAVNDVRRARLTDAMDDYAMRAADLEVVLARADGVAAAA